MLVHIAGWIIINLIILYAVFHYSSMTMQHRPVKTRKRLKLSLIHKISAAPPVIECANWEKLKFFIRRDFISSWLREFVPNLEQSKFSAAFDVLLDKIFVKITTASASKDLMTLLIIKVLPLITTHLSLIKHISAKDQDALTTLYCSRISFSFADSKQCQTRRINLWRNFVNETIIPFLFDANDCNSILFRIYARELIVHYIHMCIERISSPCWINSYFEATVRAKFVDLILVPVSKETNELLAPKASTFASSKVLSFTDFMDTIKTSENTIWLSSVHMSLVSEIQRRKLEIMNYSDSEIVNGTTVKYIRKYIRKLKSAVNIASKRIVHLQNSSSDQIQFQTTGSDFSLPDIADSPEISSIALSIKDRFKKFGSFGLKKKIVQECVFDQVTLTLDTTENGVEDNVVEDATEQADDFKNFGIPGTFSGIIEPICELFIEMFSLTAKNNWIRKKAVQIVLSQILDGTIERRIIEIDKKLKTAEFVDGAMLWIMTMFWPGSTKDPVNIDTSAEYCEEYPEMDEDYVHQSAQKQLLHVLPDLLGTWVGHSNAFNGIAKTFESLQNHKLNSVLISELAKTFISSVLE